ncbi:MAG: polysaccharide deacetylase family protein [Burkholderiales bacterium]|nr:polysaccharide deacetylase family protein [Burkholderiales bacterium]
MTKKLALKVDVDTYRGTREGVPRLIDLFKRHGVGATFLFSLGPDHTGRAIKRVFRPGFLNKVSRTSVVQHYGFPTLLYGTLLPGPDIGVRCADILRRARDEGFETGIHTWDHVRWQDGVQDAPQAWAEREMQRACNRYADVFKESPRTHGAAGWQMSLHALRATQRLGFDYCSDGRGRSPHFPVWRGEVIGCPQYPSTLPTLDELIGLNGVTEANVDQALLATTASADGDQIFTLHAELEGMRLLPVLERLIAGWTSQGFELVSTRAIHDSIVPGSLPYSVAELGTVPGRSGTLLVQGPDWPAGTITREAA